MDRIIEMPTRKNLRKRQQKRQQRGGNNLQEVNIQYETIKPQTVQTSNKKINMEQSKQFMNQFTRRANKNRVQSVNGIPHTPQTTQAARSPVSSMASTASTFSIPSRRSSFVGVFNEEPPSRRISKEEMIRKIQTMSDSEFAKFQTCLI